MLNPLAGHVEITSPCGDVILHIPADAFEEAESNRRDLGDGDSQMESLFVNFTHLDPEDSETENLMETTFQVTVMEGQAEIHPGSNDAGWQVDCSNLIVQFAG